MNCRRYCRENLIREQRRASGHPGWLKRKQGHEQQAQEPATVAQILPPWALHNPGQTLTQERDLPQTCCQSGHSQL